MLHPTIITESRITRRNVVAGTLAIGPALTFGGRTAHVSAQGLEPEATVQQFYAALNAYDYEQAYAMLTENFQESHPYQSFVDGYDDTAYVQVTIQDGETDAEQAVVWISLLAWLNDGTVQVFEGSYLLIPVGDAWLIETADIEEVDPPAETVPLMTLADLEVALVPAGAATGHHYYSVVVTNVGERYVTAAGVPHLTLRDDTGNDIIDSVPDPSVAPEAIVLEPGYAAEAMFGWSNWCEADPGPLTLLVYLPGNDEPAELPFATDEGPIPPPPCMGEAEGSTFSVRPFGYVQE